MAENAKAFAKYGARFLARGGNSEVVEGRSYSRTGTVEFKYFDTALTATTHLNMRGLRNFAKEGLTVEGYDGPQPA